MATIWRPLEKIAHQQQHVFSFHYHTYGLLVIEQPHTLHNTHALQSKPSSMSYQKAHAERELANTLVLVSAFHREVKIYCLVIMKKMQLPEVFTWLNLMRKEMY